MSIHGIKLTQTLYTQTAFLGALFVASLGIILFHIGFSIRYVKTEFTDEELDTGRSLEFTGSVIAILFWVITEFAHVFVNYCFSGGRIAL